MTIDKTNFVAGAGMAPDRMQPEGEFFIGQSPASWRIEITYGSRNAAGSYVAFATTPPGRTLPVAAGNMPAGARWKLPAVDNCQAAWGTTVWCQADLQFSLGLNVWSSQTKAVMRIK